MKGVLAIIILLTVVSCASHYKGADEELVNGFDVLPSQTLLVVKVKSSEYTGIYPYKCPAKECIPLYFWFKYQAEVLDVVAGTFEESKLSFAALHHTYFTKEVTDEWYILIEKFDNKSIDELGVQYRVLKHDAKVFHKQ